MSCDNRDCESNFKGFGRKDYITAPNECLEKCPVCTNKTCYSILKKPLFCPPDHKYCSWGQNDAGCIPKKTTCQSSRTEYKNFYPLLHVTPCQPYNKENDKWQLTPLEECSEKSLLTRKISYSKKEHQLTPRFIIDAHGSIEEGTTWIPPYMYLKTWGSWGKLQWSSINTKLINMLENRQVTPKELQKIYTDESTYSCDPQTFPSDAGKDTYELGKPPFIPYNNHCYKIVLSSHRPFKGSEKSVIKDITKTNDNTPKNLSSLQFLSPSGKKKSQYSLTDVLEWIYKYSNDTYGKYGEPSIYAGDNRTVSKIRVNLFCCLSYKKKKNCLSDFWDPSIPQKSLDDLMKIRKSIPLYKPGTRGGMKSMEYWRVDPSTTSEYNQYFHHLKEFIKKENNVELLEELYKFLSEKLYHSLLLNEILGEKYKEDRNYGQSIDIISKLKTYIAEFKLILTAIEYNSNLSRWRQRANTYEHLLRLWIFEKLRKKKDVKDLLDLEKKYLNSWINFAQKRVADDEKSNTFKGSWSEQEKDNWKEGFTRFNILPIQDNIERNELENKDFLEQIEELEEVPDLSYLLALYTETLTKLESLNWIYD